MPTVATRVLRKLIEHGGCLLRSQDLDDKIPGAETYVLKDGVITWVPEAPAQPSVTVEGTTAQEEDPVPLHDPGPTGEPDPADVIDDLILEDEDDE